MSEDYYDILGVEKDADPHTIRKAYRREAKRSHPDSSGTSNSAERFRRVEEAYETLGDVGKREAYDDRSSADGKSLRDREPSPGPGFHVSESAPLLEITLSAAEARDGVQLPLSLPLSQSCPVCARAGFWQRIFCFHCGGSGTIRRQTQLLLNIPPGIQSGGEYTVGTNLGLSGRLRVRVLVQSAQPPPGN